jgi:hypothetical protein
VGWSIVGSTIAPHGRPCDFAIVRSTIVKSGKRAFVRSTTALSRSRVTTRSYVLRSSETGSSTIVRSTIVTSGKPCDRATDHSWSRTIVRSTIVPQEERRTDPSAHTPSASSDHLILRTPWFRTPVVPPPSEPYARYIATTVFFTTT